MTGPVWMPLRSAGGGKLLTKMIFSKVCRQGECGQHHNWRGEPGDHAEHRGQSPRGG
jgi:hypothetical protein